MTRTTVFVAIAVLVSSLAVAQVMPDTVMGGGMMGGDKSKSSEDSDSQCAQMMKRMDEMMKQMSEMKTHMSRMMEGGMMGGMMGPKKKGDKEQAEKSK